METVLKPNRVAQNVKPIFDKQRKFFFSGKTKSFKFRKEQLKKLKKAIKQNEEQILKALATDLGKPRFEAFVTEITFMYEEINHVLASLEKWMQPQTVATPLVFQPGSSKITYEPLGTVLIISPWNYPFQLAMAPLVAALAAGNTAFIKPSEKTPATALLIEDMLNTTFPEELVAVVQGDGAETIPPMLENFRFNNIFFTGSVAVGKIIAQEAAKQLTPCVLELGGKSPCIVDKSAKIDVSAKRIVWGKFVNVGQTCIAPDYILVHESVKDELVAKLKKHITAMFGEDMQASPDLGRIVNEQRFDILHSYLSQGRILHGGKSDREDRFIEPTLIDNLKLDDSIMEEEVFGPILPIITYSSNEEAIDIIRRNPYPLALYLFANNKKVEKQFFENISFGGGCLNSTLLHIGNPDLPFGGVGYSGQGRYHGWYSFECMSHPKSVLTSSNYGELPLRFAPYNDIKEKIARFYFR
ncbi:UNVERIFIED_CONTAM: hypothetical protein GTU68_002032 [Idotea baltica]|nr:hypothetical protein [Idotea baltica]